MALETKKLEPDVYRALEDIVGPENITQEDVILDSYCFAWATEMVFNDKFAPRPMVVMMPGSAEEVQAIVKVCNKFKVKVKAMSTGWSKYFMGTEPTATVDLRRMDRLLEIDEKNMYVVVEPYVLYGTIMAECMKRGLRSPIAGAGPSLSALANLACYLGGGVAAITAGSAGNILACEWVLPDGELIRFGSAEMGLGWFDGDGPGPSIRGIMRGAGGAGGSRGIVTKMALRLAPWYGPDVMKTSTKPPLYDIEIPDNFLVYTIPFPSREKCYKAMEMMGQECVVYTVYRKGPFSSLAGLCESNQEHYEKWQTGYWQEECTDALQVVIDASSKRELEYRKKVVLEIVKRFDGKIPAELNEDPFIQSQFFQHAWIGIHSNRGVFRPTGCHWESAHAGDTLSAALNSDAPYRDCKESMDKKGWLLNEGDGTSTTAGMDGRGGQSHIPFRQDPYYPEAVNATLEYHIKSAQVGKDIKQHHGLAYMDSAKGTDVEKTVWYRFIQKFSKMLDPNGITFPMPATPKKLWPIDKPSKKSNLL